MPTIKQRIYISVDREMNELLTKAAKRDHVPVATKAAEFLRTALELEEDIMLAYVADSRSAQKVAYVSHKTAWQ
jgi:hypothetical protein